MPTSSTDFDDILGISAPEPPQKKRGRPTREEAAAKLEQTVSLAMAKTGRSFDDIGGIQKLRRPVTTNTLSTIFGHDVQTITKRLIDCPHLLDGNRRLYEFKDACAFIVKPRMTPEQFIKTLNKADLPPEINLAFWNAQRAKIKFMLEAGEAWETGDVLAVFGEVFMSVKDSLTTIVEDMRDRAKLTDEQTKLLEEAIDELRAAMRQKLVEMPEQKRTPSLLETSLFGTSKEIDPDANVGWPEFDEE